MTETPFSIICLSPQEWSASLPTNRQQIMRRAAERGHPVLFVETGQFVGTHLWRLILRPRRRSLLRRLFTGEAAAPGVTVRKALNVLPWGQRYRASDAVNGRISRWVVARAARGLPRPRVIWLYDPRATWAVGHADDAFGVYDCVDDYPEQATGERNRALVAAADRRAALLSRLVFTTTTPLFDRHARTNPRTHLVRNVGDFAHFAPASDRDRAPRELRDLPRPVLGFAGNFLPGKVDFELLDEIVRSLETGSLLLAGPAADGTVRRRLNEAVRHPNVTWLGSVRYEQLPSIVAAFDVGLIPYLRNEYTRSCFPLKLFEYLAAGKPVVASGLPELEGMEPDVVVASGAASFMAAVGTAAGDGDAAAVARRQAIAAANTWESRTSRLISLISQEL
ncbi:Glycosyl transferases group 1 [Gaiella occulta]|uniref:Glycosyl transferases group 1 n=1 Tax=Gaiella occulta TaxID=1002870 RepID=A0A7M2YZE0_9ACTN|nr:glycosyltransferase [Gaiella occulta]RDI74867.1 Glycosyl transferases group 1 [Gaiella occulta]